MHYLHKVDKLLPTSFALVIVRLVRTMNFRSEANSKQKAIVVE